MMRLLSDKKATVLVVALLIILILLSVGLVLSNQANISLEKEISKLQSDLQDANYVLDQAMEEYGFDMREF